MIENLSANRTSRSNDGDGFRSIPRLTRRLGNSSPRPCRRRLLLLLLHFHGTLDDSFSKTSPLIPLPQTTPTCDNSKDVNFKLSINPKVSILLLELNHPISVSIRRIYKESDHMSQFEDTQMSKFIRAYEKLLKD